MESAAQRSIRRADTRAISVEPGVFGRHCFSYGRYYDPTNVGFGPLIAANSFELEPGTEFEEHGHGGVEIVSWVVRGELTHTDSTGRSAVLRPGTAARLSAGSGVRHTEGNRSVVPLTFVQLWLCPDPGVVPEYQIADCATAGTDGGLVVVAAGAALGCAPLTLRQPGARIWAGLTGPGAVLRLPAAAGRWLLVVEGGLRGPGEVLAGGDEMRVVGAVAEEFIAGDGGAQVLVVTVDQP